MDKSLQALREEIDRLDGELTALLEARMAVVARIAAQKQSRGLPVRDPQREQAVLERNVRRLRDPALKPYLEAVLEQLIACSRAYQHSLVRPPETGEAGSGFRFAVRTGNRSCPVVLEPGILGRAEEIFDLRRRVLLVTDSGVPAEYVQVLAAQCASPRIYTLPQGEGSKTPETWQALLTAMLEAGFTRGDCVVALGGGVPGDLAGFAAASYMRGIDFYNVPTTVLAMVDSAIGGKTAVNLAGVKNVAGAFWQPRGVLMDPSVLKTLPRRQIANGLAEAVKMSLTSDPALFALLEEDAACRPMEAIIAGALAVKQTVVEADEREAGLRRVLNFGHTLGHGIEAVQSGREALLHGECVALGMLPMCAPAVRTRLIPVLEGLELPTTADFDPEAVMAAIAHDKKADPDGKITAVTVPEIGRWQFEKMTLSQLRERLQTLLPQGGKQHA